MILACRFLFLWKRKKYSGLLACRMLDLNPNKNLFFSLNVDYATSLGQVSQVTAAHRLVSRLKKPQNVPATAG